MGETPAAGDVIYYNTVCIVMFTTIYYNTVQYNLQYGAVRPIGSFFVHPKLDTRISFVRPSVRSSVTLRIPPLKSETGWTGELWLNRVLLILEN